MSNEMQMKEVYRKIYENSFDAICFLNSQYKITEANNSFMQLFKIDDAALVDFNNFIFKENKADSLDFLLLEAD